MLYVAIPLGVALIFMVLWEGFEVIILPRRVRRRFRFTTFSYRIFWNAWKHMGRTMSLNAREDWLGIYGPFSLIMLLGGWVAGIVMGFALLHWAAGSVKGIPGGHERFLSDVYLSGTTFFTLGIGDVVPHTAMGRLLTVLESALGLGFLALVISYFPALNQSFSRRETNVSMLDARAGTPPSAYEMLRRHSDGLGLEALRQLLLEWEQWAAELLESHQSYPVLAYFRSQHDNQSWVSALTAILDACAFLIVHGTEAVQRQARMTFAAARHAVVDLSLVFRLPPQPPMQDRLPSELLAEMHARLHADRFPVREDAEAEAELTQLREMYDPFVTSLSRLFAMELPPWMLPEARKDDWQVSEWEGKMTGMIHPE